MEIRIPRYQKYAYINLDKEDVLDPQIDKVIEKSIELINKYAVADLEIVLKDKLCPDCGKRLFEQIGISDKNNKPYHRIKCEDNNEKGTCKYIQWVSVESK